MGPHFLAFSGKLSVKRQEKKQGLFSEYIEAHRQKFRHFQAKKIDQKNLLGDFPLASSNVVYL